MKVLEQIEERPHERALLDILYRQAEQLRGKPAYEGFHHIVRKLMSAGLYGNWIHHYSANEIKWLGLQIVPESDQLLSIGQLRQYMNEFVTCNHYDWPMGLPQERLMLIAMAAMQNETVHRLQKVQETYWVLSKGYVTLPDEVMAFLGKTFSRRQSTSGPHSMDLLDMRIQSYLSGKVKEKHIRIPHTFMEQVKACGSWLVFDTEEVQRVLNCSLHDVDSDTFRQAVAHPAITHKKLSAIGLMKQLLSSDGVVFHFEDEFQTEITGLRSSIQLPHVMRNNVLARVCSIQVRLLNGILDFWEREDSGRDLHIEATCWEELLADQRIGLHSEQALSFIEKLSEQVSFHVIKASLQLAKEHGPYLQFEGSDWQNGSYFEQRGYISEAWQEVSNEIELHGVRNGTLRKASDTVNLSGHPLTKHQQFAMINRLAAQQRHTETSGSIILEKSSLIENAELLQLLMNAWSCGIREVRIK
ncbi:ribonucleotide reductase N-terminal alpha domain-containing protein [Sporosarcina sp.]|uniref:ribonucleotide reductase N-terminal alpha domain-containing protein n=1 Tax=Sporosarcina sp. TaxID=49982 RepID=UPI00263241F8|nr:ribonucleotide reductase N-terminal alpha domain-containing protein [Sporosarcina sp.]